MNRYWNKTAMAFGLAAMSGWLDAAEIRVNTYPMQTNDSNGKWTFTIQQKFTGKTPVPAYFLLHSQSFLPPSPAEKRRGYGYQIELKFKVPGPAAKVSGSAVIANYNDSKPRSFFIEYSTDEITYKRPAVKSYKGGETRLNFSFDIPEKSPILRIFIGAEDPAVIAAMPNPNYGRKYATGYSAVIRELNLSLEGMLQPAYDPAYYPGKPLRSHFLTAVSYPWERIRQCARRAGMSPYDQFAEKTMRLLKEHNVRDLGILNMLTPGREARQVLAVADRVGLRVLPQTMVNGQMSKAGGLHLDLPAIERSTRITVNGFADFKSLDGYVVMDEPLNHYVSPINYNVGISKKLDPTRDMLTCTTRDATVNYTFNSKFPVIMDDLYYFGFDHSNHVTWPQAKSMRKLTRGLEYFNRIADIQDRPFWFIAQYYYEIWGVHYFASEEDYRAGKVTVEPGAYLHWRCPTPAELCWQLWEAVRLGSKGLRIFIGLPGQPLVKDPAKDQLTPAEKTRLAKMKKSNQWLLNQQKSASKYWSTQKLVTQKTVIENQHDGLLYRDGTPRPILKEVAEIYGVMNQNEKMLMAKKRAPFPAFFGGDSDTKTGTFTIAGSEKLYGVAVNAAVNSPERTVAILVPRNTTRLVDLNHGKELSLRPEGTLFKKAEISLKPGRGVLLEAEFSAGQPGISIFHEQFTPASIIHLNSNAKIVRDDHGLPMVQLTAKALADQPVLRINLRHLKRKTPGVVFCRVYGQFSSGITVRAVSDNSKKKEVNNLAHLKLDPEKQQMAAKNGKIICKGNYQLPVEVPAETTDLEIYADNPEIRIMGVDVWFAPDPAE